MSIEASAHVWKHSKQAGSRLLLLVAIADYSNAEGWSWPSISSLCARIRLGERYVQKMLRELVNANELLIRERTNASNYYRILGMDGVNYGSPGGEQGFVAGVNRGSPKPSVEPSNPSNEGARKRAVNNVVTTADLDGYHFPHGLDTPEVHAAVEGWRAYKTGEHRDKFTLRMLNVIFEKGKEWGAIQLAANIKHSMEANYRGIFPAKPVNRNDGPKKETASGTWVKDSKSSPTPPEVSEEERARIAAEQKAQMEQLKRDLKKSNRPSTSSSPTKEESEFDE